MSVRPRWLAEMNLTDRQIDSLLEEGQPLKQSETTLGLRINEKIKRIFLAGAKQLAIDVMRGTVVMLCIIKICVYMDRNITHL